MMQGTVLLKGALLVALAAMLMAPGAARADDLTGAERLICAASSVVICWDDGTCEAGSPAELNVPQFIEVDMKGKRLSTTRASGEDRSTSIPNMVRGNGQIVLQGYENGRAFSFMIAEKTGMMSVAVAADGRSVAVFGACTPVPSSR